jgi:arylsulfatase A-like enzyme
VARAPVSNIDLVATMIEASGVAPGLPQDGAALERGAAGRRPPILIEMLSQRTFAAIRTPRYILAEYDKGGTELYDLRRDPYELENLRRDPALRRVRRELGERLDSLRDCSAAACRAPAAQSP